MAEDILGHMKNRKVELAARDYRKPETAFAAGIAAQVPDVRHKFKPVDFSGASVPKSDRLPEDAFQTKRGTCSVNVDAIASNKPQTDWHSPTPCSASTPVADLFVLRHLKEQQDLRAVETCWLGELCDIKHRFVIRYNRQGKELYYVVGKHFKPDSGVLAWPVMRQRLDGAKEVYNYIPNMLMSPSILAIFTADPKIFQVCKFSFMSPAGQRWRYPESEKLWAKRLRLMEDGVFMTLFELAAWEAFWGVCKHILEKCAKLLGIRLTSNCNLFEVLWALIEFILKVDEDVILQILLKRLVRFNVHKSFDHAVLAFDEAIDVMDPMDHKKVKQEQKNVKIECE